MHTFIQRSVWSLVWCVVIAIAVALNLDMAREQPILFALVAVCLLVVGIGLHYTRSHYKAGNFGEAVVTLFVGALCLGVVVISEVSFWSASIEGVQSQIEREQAKVKGLDIVQERRRAQLAQNAGGKLPSQIEAEIANAGARELSGLRLQLRAARELQELEGKVFADSTETVSTTTVKRTFFKAAQIGAEQFGGKVQDWVTAIVVWMVLTMTMLHLAALYVGFAPIAPAKKAEASQKPTERLPDLVVAKAPVVESKPSLPSLTLPEAPKPDLDRIVSEVAKLTPITPGLEKIVGDLPKPMPTVALEPATVAPKIDIGGQQVQESVSAPASAFFDANIVDLLTPKQRRKLAQDRVKKKGVKVEGSVKDWISECSTQVPHEDGKGATSEQCWESYFAWCLLNSYQPIGRKALTRRMGVILGRATGERGDRDGKGATWKSLRVVTPSAQPLKARA